MRDSLGGSKGTLSVDPWTLHELTQDLVNRYAPLESPRGTLGIPWSPQRQMDELAKLRDALVTPYKAEVEIPPDEAQRNLNGGPHWVVARAGEFVVYYDEAFEVFGLAIAAVDGSIGSINVRGELVDVFMAR